MSRLLFSVEETEENVLFKLFRPDLKKRDRMDLVMNNTPSKLSITRRPLTEEERAETGFVRLDLRPGYMDSNAGRKPTTILFVKYMSPQETFDAGLWPDMILLQRILADPDFIAFLNQVDGSNEHDARRGSTYDIAFTFMPGHQPSGIKLSKACRSGNETVRLANVLLANLYTECIKAAGFQRKDKDSYVINASVTIGLDSNTGATTVQVNYSLPGTREEALKDKGKGHVDKNDHPANFTVLLNLSNLPENHYSGVFTLLSVGAFALNEQFSVFIMSDRHPHDLLGDGEYEDGYPASKQGVRNLHPHLPWPTLPDHWLEVRISVPVYLRMDYLAARLREINSELWGPKALTAFGTQRNHQEWKMLHFVKENHHRISITPEKLVELFSWVNEAGEHDTLSISISRLALQCAGKAEPQLDQDWRKAALWADCGTNVDDDDDEEEEFECSPHEKDGAEEEEAEVEYELEEDSVDVDVDMGGC